MRINIRSKLILAISALMVVVFLLAAYLFISEKRVEMAEDIFHNTLTFGRLTSPTVAYNYDLYLAEDGFVYFNRELQGIFEQNDDIASIQVVSYEGEILYDSSKDVDKKYDGEPRNIESSDFLSQVRSENVSVRLQDGRIVFLKKDLKGDLIYIDENERPLDDLEKGVLLDLLAVPASEKYSVIYYLDYSNLEERIGIMISRILYLAIFGIMLGMILSFVMSSNLTNPVQKLVAAAGKIATGDLKARTDIQTHDELSFLGKAFNKMAEDLEASLEARIYQERVTHELELATEIQKQIIPKNIPEIEGADVASGLVPAEEIGGDVYDFLPVGQNKLLMYLGDVTGHGVPAGIVGSIASALFYGYSTEGDLAQIMIKVNKILHVKTMPNMFMTICLMEWDGSSKSFQYVSAGHEQIIKYKVSEGKVSLCDAGGIALGMLEDVSNHVKSVNVPLEIGDFLVIYSDGIPEAWKNDKDNYGMERLVKFVGTCGSLGSAEEIKEAILNNVKEFTAGYKQQDDITIIVLKRTS